jgi:hypothetical protein
MAGATLDVSSISAPIDPGPLGLPCCVPGWLAGSLPGGWWLVVVVVAGACLPVRPYVVTPALPS